MFLRQRGDLLDLDRGAELDLVAGDRRAAGVAGHLRVDVELLQHLGQPPDDVVGRLGAGLVHRARLEHLAVGQRVGDVAGQRELLDARGQRRVRRRLEGLLGGTADVGGLLGVGQVEVDLGVALRAPRRRTSRPSRPCASRTGVSYAGSPSSGSISSVVPAERAPRVARRAPPPRAAGAGPSGARRARAAARAPGRRASRSRPAPRRRPGARAAAPRRTSSRAGRSAAWPPRTRSPRRPAAAGGCRRARGSARRWRCARGPRTPKSSAVQPTTWRPAGPLRSGSRRLRHATKHSRSGTNQAMRPTEPATTARTASASPPGSCHHTQAATTTASPTSIRPAPSRRCSGSSSPAVCPTRRTADPMACATPSQAATTTRVSALKTRKTGPGPLRTARGAGRFAVERAAALRGAGLRPDLVPVVRPREVEPPLPERAEELLLRDAVGEDVRVAMVANLPPTPHPPLASHAEPPRVALAGGAHGLPR